MEDGSLLRLGSGPASGRHQQPRAGTLTGESLGWAGSGKFNEGSLLVLTSLPRGGTKHVLHQRFTSKALELFS